MNGELTLEMAGPAITADKFETGIRSFLAIIKDVSQEVSKETDGPKKGIKWSVRVEPGSVRVCFVATSEKTPETIPSVLSSISNGMQALETKAEKPPYFSDSTLSNAKNLAAIQFGEPQGINSVRILQNGYSISLSENTVKNVQYMVGAYCKDWGTLEGQLSVISERNGYSFNIYDSLTGKPVRCMFKEDILDKVVKAFGKRVAVSGLIRYRRNGDPISIKVSDSCDFHEFRDRNSLPQVTEIISRMTTRE